MTKKYNIRIVDRKSKYLGKICAERPFNDLNRVKHFWKGNFAIKLSGVTTATSKAFQVNAQNRRQGQQFDTL